jgi:hypothetical protein
MADVQTSAPLVDENLTDQGWRAVHAGYAGIVGDVDGSAFGLTLPPSTDVAEIGSATQPSRVVVDGFALEVPEGSTQSLEIPPSSGGGTNGRTDLIVARLNPSSFTTAPGPVRLHRVAGTEGSTARPAAVYQPNGIRDVALYAIRRRQGESLNQAIVTDLRPRIGNVYDVPINGTLPTNVPLGSRASRGFTLYRRDNAGSGIDWIEEALPREVVEGITAIALPGEGFLRQDGSRMVRDGVDGKDRFLKLVVWKGSPARNPNPAADGRLWVGTIHDQDRPIGPDQTPLTGWAIDQGGTERAAIGHIAPNGQIWWTWASVNSPFGADGRDKTLVLTGSWKVA